MKRGQKIEQMYLKLINEYGESLPKEKRETAREIFNELMTKQYFEDYSFSFIYWSLWNLGYRDLIQNRYLLYNKNFQDEVIDILINKEHYSGIEKFVINRTIIVDILNTVYNIKPLPVDFKNEMFNRYTTYYEKYRKSLNEATKYTSITEKTDFSKVNSVKEEIEEVLEKELTEKEIDTIENIYVEYYLKQMIIGAKKEWFKHWITGQELYK